jgi:hypothetical protein
MCTPVIFSSHTLGERGRRAYNTFIVMTEVNIIGRQLAESLSFARERMDTRAQETAHTTKLNVVGAGAVITAAFEQLRNVAENTEEHLLLQSSIRRFYKRLFVMRDGDQLARSGEELAVELTYAGYVQNDSLPVDCLQKINQLAVDYYAAYEHMLDQKLTYGQRALSWTLDVLASRIESMLNPHVLDQAFVATSSEYLGQLVSDRDRSAQDFGARLLVAIYRSLLKSNDGVIRSILLERYGVEPTELTNYAQLNNLIDELLTSKPAERLTRLVDRNGAPLRVLRRMIHDNPDTRQLLGNREHFLEAYEVQIGREYERISTRLNRAIVRSVLFLIITKFLIGIAVEVPYDIWREGTVRWAALLVNLFFPPLYMIALRLTLSLPTYANTTALIDHIDRILYGTSEQIVTSRVKDRRYSKSFSIIYSVIALAIFALVTWLLIHVGFTVVHIVIFFIFVSAASFLGFRLSRMIRELEVIRPKQNSLTFVRDIIYLPFVVVGQWMSEKYAKFNIIATLLDMVIELPLKMIRQWNAFIDDRKDSI